jgi:hypothetical protein
MVGIPDLLLREQVLALWLIWFIAKASLRLPLF